MELIVAMFILAGWYAYKKFRLKKSEPAAVALVIEAEIVEKRAKKVTCDFCDGRRGTYLAQQKKKCHAQNVGVA